MRQLFKPVNTAMGTRVAALFPLVDMLTLLLVAVLRTSSSQPALLVPEAGFVLPRTTAEAPISRGLAIDIGPETLWVNGWRVGASSYWRDADDTLIPEVLNAVQAASPDHVLIRSTGDAQWQLVGKVLWTVQQAGVPSVELVALSQMSL
jgi:biopolymer transport protein ExbD